MSENGMTDFLIENIWNIIIVILIIAAVVFAIVKIRSNRKKGSCGYGCEGCIYSGQCKKIKEDNK